MKHTQDCDIKSEHNHAFCKEGRAKMRIKCDNCNGLGYIYSSKLGLRRKELGLKQDKVAKALGVTRSQYSMIETGRSNITAEKIRPLASILQITTDELLDGLESKDE